MQSTRRLAKSQQRLPKPTGRNSSVYTPSFNNVEQKQMAVPAGNDPRLLKSMSFRNAGSMGQNLLAGQQGPMSGLMINANFQNQDEGKAIPRLGLRRNMSGNNLLGNMNPVMATGPGNMVRSTSARSMMGISPKNLNNNDAFRNNSMRSLRPGLVRTSSQPRIHGNNDTRAAQQQAPRLMRGTSARHIGSNTALMNSSMPSQSQRQGLMKMASQKNVGTNNALLNHNSMHSRPPGSTRASQLQRSRDVSNGLLNNSKHCDPKRMKNEPEQSHIGMGKKRWLAVDSVSALSGLSGDDSVVSRRSRNRVLAQSLADQIYSRSRHGDIQSVVSSGDPPGLDIKHLKNYRKERFSDDCSYNTTGDDQEIFITPNDPPDMFEGDQSYSESTMYESESHEENYESFESDYDRRTVYSDDDSSDSSFDEDDKYYYKMLLSGDSLSSDSYSRESGGSLSDSSVTSGSSVTGQIKSMNTDRSCSRFSSDLAFEYDQEIDPPKRTSSFTKTEWVRDYESESASDDDDDDDDDDSKNGVGATSQQEHIGWLARQISNRKLIIDEKSCSHSMDPKGTSIAGDHDSSSINSESDSDLEDIFFASTNPRHSVNLVPVVKNRREVMRADRDIFDENSSLQSESDYIVNSETSDDEVSSLAKIEILGLDDRTLTTDSMSQEIPFVVISKRAAANNGYKDSDSLLSSPKCEMEQKISRTKSETESEKGEIDSLENSKRQKSASKSSKKKEHPSSSVSTKKIRKKKQSKKRKKKKGADECKKNNAPREEISSKVKRPVNEPGTSRNTAQKKKSKTKKSKNEATKSKSSKKKNIAEGNIKKDSDKTKTDGILPSTSAKGKKPRKSTTKTAKLKDGTSKKPKKKTKVRSKTSSTNKQKPKPAKNSSSRYSDEKVDLEDESVFNLIDKLKKYELD